MTLKARFDEPEWHMSQARQAVPLAAWYEARAQARARRRRNRVLRRWGFALALAIGAYLVLAYSPAKAAELGQIDVRVTFYVEHGVMASGAWTHKDAAACSRWMPFGTQLQFPDGYVVTCEDRGHGDWYWPAWVDVHAESYAWGIENVERAYGTYTTVRVIRWGWGA